ncbi:adhesion G- coupled receptor D1-like [Paramuricea clavata]|uniref:Adhesion G- coupled receptor D1-like n=1 Tax=Paramuricea clavata TaxID=317549 RepID=A0A6S7G490_PARCT|nr:adhesion G- coupled receptor D1-like [Paramuricea clavata]
MKNEAREILCVDELHRKNISNERRKEVAQIIINRLLNLTDLDKMDENGVKQQVLNDTVTILQTIVDLNISDSNLNILDPANNILDSRNTKSWRNMCMKDDKLIRDLVTTLENYAFQHGENLKNNSNASTIFQNYSNVQLYVKFIKREDNLSAEERLFEFPDASFNLSPDALPQSSGAVVVVLWYKTINSFLTTSLHDDHSYAEINSKIMTASVRPEPKDKFLQPVRISWNMKELNDSATCVYWKPELNEKWKTDGCTRVKDMPDSDILICECDHLTAFAAMDISREMVSKTERRALELISTIGCSVSLFGIFLTILAHALLWRRLQQNAKSKVPSQVLMHLCVAIGVTDILSILAGPAHNYETFCTTVSILLYFFVLAVFGWMLCEGVIIYLQLVNVYTGLSLGGKHLKVFYVIGWGIPVVVVAVLVALNDRKDFITKHTCWCPGDGVLFWTFVCTIGLILLINLVIFVLALRSALSSSTVNTARSLSPTKDSTGTTKPTAGTTLRKAKLGLKGSAILLPLLGLTWVFGLLVFNRDTIVFKYLFAICNSLQGMMIFVFHVLINKKIHEAISREKKAREAKHITKIVVNNTCGTLSTSDGNRRKSSIPVTPTFAKKNFNKPESLTVIQNNTTKNNNGSSASKQTKLYLEPERNQRNCRSRGMKNNYTTKNNNNSLKSNRNKPAYQFNAVILEDLELAKPQ